MDNRVIYQGWKKALAKNGKTPMDMVEHYRSIGMGEYADSLLAFIQQNDTEVPMEEKKMVLQKIGEPHTCSDAEWYRHILRCLLHYHERMMLPNPTNGLIDSYAEALKEAIRCIEIVHEGEFSE